jgi:hypothetical protein
MTATVKEKKNQVETLHARATGDLIYTLKNPPFEEYFDLLETKSGDVYKDGVLQIIQKQRELKEKLEHAIYNFQEKFQVDETCLIDTSGKKGDSIVVSSVGKGTTFVMRIPKFSDYRDMPKQRSFQFSLN